MQAVGPSREAGVRTARDAGKQAVRLFGMGTAPMRPFPDFLIIGTKRGGTTSLFRYLAQHPGVLPLFPSARLLPMREDMKGVHYFDTGYRHGRAWYRSHFPSVLARRRAEGRAGGPVVAGESSPYYLFHPHAAARAAGTVPGARIIALLRDPVERTYSHYSEQRRNGVETLGFEEALAAEPHRLAGEADRMAADPSYRSFAHEHQSYATQSEYLPGLERWMRAFSAEQVLVLQSEDLYRDPQGTCDRALAHLGLEPLPLHDARVWNAPPRADMPTAARRDLEQRFGPHNERLSAFLGVDLGWQR